MEDKTDNTRQDKGWKPPKVGVVTGKRSPQNRDSVRPARDTANFGIWTAGRKRPPPEVAFQPPRTPISRAPGAHRATNRAHCIHIDHAIQLGAGVFPPKRPPRPGKSKIYIFGPFRALDGYEISPSPSAPQKPVNRELRPQEAEPLKRLQYENCAGALRFQRAPNGPTNYWRRQVTAETTPRGKGGWVVVVVGVTHPHQPLAPKSNRWCKPTGT